MAQSFYESLASFINLSFPMRSDFFLVSHFFISFLSYHSTSHDFAAQSSTTIYFILVDCRQSVCFNQGADRGLVSLSLYFFPCICCTLKHWVFYPSIPPLIFHILNLSLLLVEFDSFWSCGSKPFCSLLFLFYSITTL